MPWGVGAGFSSGHLNLRQPQRTQDGQWTTVYTRAHGHTHTDTKSHAAASMVELCCSGGRKRGTEGLIVKRKKDREEEQGKKRCGQTRILYCRFPLVFLLSLRSSAQRACCVRACAPPAVMLVHGLTGWLVGHLRACVPAHLSCPVLSASSKIKRHFVNC
jgi:hypothetical protein